MSSINCFSFTLISVSVKHALYFGTRRKGIAILPVKIVDKFMEMSPIAFAFAGLKYLKDYNWCPKGRAAFIREQKLTNTELKQLLWAYLLAFYFGLVVHNAP
jgi:hypothetical protein